MTDCRMQDPVSHKPLTTPVIGFDGYIYNKADYEGMISKSNQSPLSNIGLTRSTFPRRYVKLENFLSNPNDMAAFRALATDPFTGQLMNTPVIVVYDVVIGAQHHEGVLVCDKSQVNMLISDHLIDNITIRSFNALQELIDRKRNINLPNIRFETQSSLWLLSEEIKTQEFVPVKTANKLATGMRVKLKAKLHEPKVDEYHALEPGTGYLSFDSSHSSGNRHFIAHVKLENGKLGSVMIPIDVMATKDIRGYYGMPTTTPIYEYRFSYSDQNFFGGFNRSDSSADIKFMESRIGAVENWLQTDEAKKQFREMAHCEYNRYYGVGK